MKFKDKLKYFFLDNKIGFIVAISLGVFIVLIFTILNNSWTNLVGYCDATFSASGILLCAAGFSFVNYHGAFDMFSYSFSKKKRKEMGEDYYQYAERKALERKTNKLVPVPYLLISLLFFIIALIIFAIINGSYLG